MRDIFILTKQRAQQMFDAAEITDNSVCTWCPEICQEPAVRLAMFSDGRKYELTLLCERHKQMGMWFNKTGVLAYE